MGQRSSKAATPPPPPFLEKPWREINWGDKQNALEYVNNYQPQTERQHLRILLYGLVGAGKSSFINSVNSVLRNRMCTQALVESTSHGSCTKRYTTYRIPKGNTCYPFVLNDMMGLQMMNRRNRKIHVKDVKRLLKGHIKDGYTFNPECKISKEDQYYNQAPTASDKVHVLVFVIDANRKALMKNEAVETIQDIKDEANELGIPQVAIFSKIDDTAAEIKEDVKNVYKSQMLKERMEQFSADVGIPMNCSFAVQNYTNINFNNDADVLLLSALRHIIDFGDDFLTKMLEDQEHELNSV